MTKKVFVDVELNFPKQLEKDMQEGEIICPTCKGVGLVLSTQIYGLQGEKHPSGMMFPYKYQTLVPCNACYNGVVKVCKHCGKPGDRRYTSAEYGCDCEGARLENRNRSRQKLQERWDKSKKIILAEAVERFTYLYVEETEKFIYPCELPEYLEEMSKENPHLEIEYIYGTTVSRLTLNANELVEDECTNQELHEEAFERIGDADIKELQEFLNNWCEKVREDTITYKVDYSVGVIRP